MKVCRLFIKVLVSTFLFTLLFLENTFTNTYFTKILHQSLPKQLFEMVHHLALAGNWDKIII